jgi:hypothetical protein
MTIITSSFSLPKSKGSTVRVSVLKAGVLVLPSSTLVQPYINGHETIEAPIYSFLVENETVGKKALFDLGMMKTWKEKLPQRKSRHCPGFTYRRIASFRVPAVRFLFIGGCESFQRMVQVNDADLNTRQC